MAIKDRKFLVVGSNADVEAVAGEGTEVVDLSGGFAMPGLEHWDREVAAVAGLFRTPIATSAYPCRVLA